MFFCQELVHFCERISLLPGKQLLEGHTTPFTSRSTNHRVISSLTDQIIIILLDKVLHLELI